MVQGLFPRRSSFGSCGRSDGRVFVMSRTSVLSVVATTVRKVRRPSQLGSLSSKQKFVWGLSVRAMVCGHDRTT
jgi:hypothetical protein